MYIWSKTINFPGPRVFVDTKSGDALKGQPGDPTWAGVRADPIC